jgi:hypothetical protein
MHMCGWRLQTIHRLEKYMDIKYTNASAVAGQNILYISVAKSAICFFHVFLILFS